eukprot:3375087-Rhodomonas_salina.1
MARMLFNTASLPHLRAQTRGPSNLYIRAGQRAVAIAGDRNLSPPTRTLRHRRYRRTASGDIRGAGGLSGSRTSPVSPRLSCCPTHA